MTHLENLRNLWRAHVSAHHLGHDILAEAFLELYFDDMERLIEGPELKQVRRETYQLIQQRQQNP